MARRVVAFARASYPCEADNEHELSFVRGDVLDIFECGNDGWWTAKLGGREGLVPQQYIKPVQSVDAVLHFIRLYYSDRPNIFIRKDVNADAVQQVNQLLGGGSKHVVLVQHSYKCIAYALAQAVRAEMSKRDRPLIPTSLYNTIVAMDTNLGGSGYVKDTMAPLYKLLKSKMANLPYLTLAALFRCLGSLKMWIRGSLHIHLVQSYCVLKYRT